MEIRQLRYFISVAETLNFTEAAKRLFITQSAVSYQISSLEEELNTQLFIRNKREVHLTTMGEILLEEARGILAKTDNAVHRIRLAELGTLGKINVGHLVPMANDFIPNILRQFNQQYPNITLNFTRFPFISPGEILDNDIDVGFSILFSDQDVPVNIGYHTLYTENIVVVMNSTHYFAKESSIEIEQLKGEPYVTFSSDYAPVAVNWIIQTCKKRGFLPNMKRQFSDLEPLLLSVASGIGITTLTRLEVQLYPHLRLCSSPLNGEDARTIVFWRKNCSNPSVPLLLRLFGINSKD